MIGLWALGSAILKMGAYKKKSAINFGGFICFQTIVFHPILHHPPSSYSNIM
jgi:hypothetical protein